MQQQQPSEQQIIGAYQKMKQECSSLSQKINELEMEQTEHGLVLDTIKTLEPERRCFRQVGNVLVERSVKEVMPAVEKNREEISTVIQSLVKEFQRKQVELEKFAEKHQIRERPAGGGGGPGGLMG
eukprot:TRINITY_DN16774_c0_g1_i1.p1 TRINITY_DN16774_c0_g1~~TRINITY_DN16774_c0_g1_i1.p1  ORF type:complete len:126 (+),score=34.46 TRINITY_DN16774_c0_g1_i1:175-552(+)